MTFAAPHPHRPVLDDELEKLRTTVARMGELVDVAMARALVGLTDRDVETCTAVIVDDAGVNALHREARELSFTILLTQTPLGADFRETMSLLHMSSELERMGDHCVSIAKIARDLADLPSLPPTVDLSSLGRCCAGQVQEILVAVIAQDVQRARRVAARDDRVDRVYHRVFDDLIELMNTDARTIYPATKLVLIAHHLERIADRVTNIAEDLVYVETGVMVELG